MSASDESDYDISDDENTSRKSLVTKRKRLSTNDEVGYSNKTGNGGGGGGGGGTSTLPTATTLTSIALSNDKANS